MNKEEFIKQYCPSCGTQRCDSSDVWIEGCELYNQHVLGINPVDDYKAVEDLKNDEKEGILNMFKHWKEIILEKL